MKKRLILVGRWEQIEPLGILHLLGLAQGLGWECEVELIKNFDFTPLYETVQRFKPDLVGFSVWTGWHLQTFEACDYLRNRGIRVTIGGPHATYFTDECARHADWAVKGDGFRAFRMILEAVEGRRNLVSGKIHSGEENKEIVVGLGTLFDTKRMAEGFPFPNRNLVYRKYPHLANSPIKSIMCSEGCPFTCSYCYAPSYNEIYGGFKLNMRPVEDVIREALEIRDNWPLSMIYMQDDIFGYREDWLEKFAARWRKEVNVPFHCQIRLELTRSIRRLELLREAGCTGITLAIEHGSEWMRRFVLDRHMTIEDIEKGMEKLRKLGFRVRTEQIYGVPFSTIDSDLETLKMNYNFPGLSMYWCSILAPYLGTLMGTIASNFRFYPFNNDDLAESFFGRSVMCYNQDGRVPVEGAVLKLVKDKKHNPLRNMRVSGNPDSLEADVLFGTGQDEQRVAKIQYLDLASNDLYRSRMVVLQRLSNFFVRVPSGAELAERFVKQDNWTWQNLGSTTRDHLCRQGLNEKLEGYVISLADQLGLPFDSLPEGVRLNPWYFCYFPAAAPLVARFIQEGIFAEPDTEKMLDSIQTVARHHLFAHELYRLESYIPAIASR